MESLGISYFVIPGLPIVQDPKELLSYMAKYFNVKINNITGKSRKRDFVIPRQVYIYYAYSVFKNRYETKSEAQDEIGKIVNRDRCTVIYSIKTVENLYTCNKYIKEKINELDRMLIYLKSDGPS